jgi:hypothetical protein
MNQPLSFHQLMDNGYNLIHRLLKQDSPMLYVKLAPLKPELERIANPPALTEESLHLSEVAEVMLKWLRWQERKYNPRRLR